MGKGLNEGQDKKPREAARSKAQPLATVSLAGNLQEREGLGSPSGQQEKLSGNTLTSGGRRTIDFGESPGRCRSIQEQGDPHRSREGVNSLQRSEPR